jgi:hypothetical protein
MHLGGDDSKALIEALGQLGVDVAALRRATIGRK